MWIDQISDRRLFWKFQVAATACDFVEALLTRAEHLPGGGGVHGLTCDSPTICNLVPILASWPDVHVARCWSLVASRASRLRVWVIAALQGRRPV
jgi:hypothetical protein